MSPLSALRSASVPDFRILSLPKAAVTSGQAISYRELETIGNLPPATAPPPSAKAGAAGGSFESTLGQMVADVNGRQAAASETAAALLSGQNVPLHQAMIAMEEASVSFQLMVEVRNRLLESYQELMRMQV